MRQDQADAQVAEGVLHAGVLAAQLDACSLPSVAVALGRIAGIEGRPRAALALARLAELADDRGRRRRRRGPGRGRETPIVRSIVACRLVCVTSAGTLARRSGGDRCAAGSAVSGPGW